MFNVLTQNIETFRTGTDKILILILFSNDNDDDHHHHHYTRYIMEVSRRAIAGGAFDGQSSSVSQPWAATIVEEPTNLSLGDTFEDGIGEVSDFVDSNNNAHGTAFNNNNGDAGITSERKGSLGMLSPEPGQLSSEPEEWALNFVVHQATDLPADVEHQSVKPFVRLHSEVKGAVLVTCPAVETPTTMPVWHAAAEVLVTPAEVTTGDEMVFEVADEITGSILASFPVPLRNLRP